MSVLINKDERFAAAATFAERRALSLQTPWSWLPNRMKKAFTDSAGRLQDSRVVNYTIGYSQGMLTAFSMAAAARHRLALSAVCLAVAIGSEFFHQWRGGKLQSASTSPNPT